MPTPQTCEHSGEPFWHWQLGRIEIKDFHFVSAGDGFAVGEPNSLLSTTDGGRSWRVSYLPANHNLNALSFQGKDKGWIVGNAGIILHSEDGGQNWEAQESEVAFDLYALFFLDDRMGWAAGEEGNVLRTTDGGQHWTIHPAGRQIDIVDLLFLDNNRGYLVGHNGPTGYVLLTEDGGVTWQESDYWGSVPETIYADGSGEVFLAGGWVGGSIWRGIGHDSRTSVVQNQLPSSCAGTGYHFREIAFLNTEGGWAIGDCGLSMATQDGGGTWQSMGLHKTADWRHIQMLSNSEIIFAGVSWIQDGIVIAHSTDAGETWSLTMMADAFSHHFNVIAMDFVDPWFGWVLGEVNVSIEEVGQAFLRTDDSGNSWHRVKFPEWEVYNITFVDPLRGWLLGPGALVARTDDGGTSWEIVPIASRVDFLSLAAPDRDHVYLLSAATGAGTCQEEAYRDPGHLTLLRSSNGGSTWEDPVCIEVPQAVNEAYSRHTAIPLPLRTEFSTVDAGWIVGAQGLVMKTLDGGETWQAINAGSTLDLLDLSVVDAQTVWVAGDYGLILSTNDGGESWEQHRLGGGRITGLHFLDAEHGWLISSEYPISVHHTSDGGISWQRVYRTNTEMMKIDATDGEHVWVGGAGSLRAFLPTCSLGH
jgi:photosystem II stability/assembly factor-like uncharacterized protein